MRTEVAALIVFAALAPGTPSSAFAQDGGSQRPEGCAIKGNVSKGKRKLYFLPSDNNYARVKISPDKGERWFCREIDAVAAGWQRAGQRTNCRRDPLDAIPATDAPKPGCHIKGNATGIYHAPGGRCYSETSILRENAPRERWFCSEAEAIAAGWRASKI